MNTLKTLGHVLKESFKPPNLDAKGQYSDEQQKLIDDNTIAATWIDFATTSAPKKLVKGITLAKEKLEILDEEYKLGREGCDLEALNGMVDDLKLCDGEKSSVFFVKLQDLNGKFDNFKVSGGKDYKRDYKELLIKVANSCR